MATGCLEYEGRRNDKGYGVDGYGRLIHRKVLVAIEGRPLLPGEIVMHTCDNPPCILYSHLRRATQQDNVRDRDEKGRRIAPAGELHSNAKLTEQAVREIRATVGQTTALALKFGVSRQAVKYVRQRKSWRHI